MVVTPTSKADPDLCSPLSWAGLALNAPFEAAWGSVTAIMRRLGLKSPILLYGLSKDDVAPCYRIVEGTIFVPASQPDHDPDDLTPQKSQERANGAGLVSWILRDRDHGLVHLVHALQDLQDETRNSLPTELASAVHQALAYFVEAITLRNIVNSDDFRPPSAREIECLRWCAIGRRTGEIATTLKLSEATVNEHILRGMRRLKSGNRTQACFRAALLETLLPSKFRDGERQE